MEKPVLKPFFPLLFCSLFIFVGTYAAESEFLRKGISYYQSEEYELAAAHLEEAKKAEPRNPKVYFILGNSYFQLDELDSAIVNYTAGLDYAKNKGPFFLNLGNCYYLKNNYQFATDMYAQAVLNDPALFDAYLNAGNAYLQSKEYQKTIIQWETFLEKDPKTPQYDKIEKAIAYLREEVKRQEAAKLGKDSKTGLDTGLLDDVLKDLEGLINRTQNVLETSEKPVDDLTREELER
ncbi:MAG: tetratricopeptide repeat protein [Spirochaetes bacterium]|nr:tetratricopeptide repeat protein [Spirochaetota bacterium]